MEKNMDFFAKKSKEKKYKLIYHLLDVKYATRYIWDEFLPKKIKKQIAQDLGVDAEVAIDVAIDVAAEIISTIAGLHDIGKATDYFQKNVLENEGQNCLSKNHALISGCYLIQKSKYPEESDYPIFESFAQYISYHHSVVHTSVTSKSSLSLDYVKKQLDNLDSVFDKYIEISSIDDWKNITLTKEHPPWMLIFTGMTSFADWIVSDTRYWEDKIEEYDELKGIELAKTIQENVKDFLKKEKIIQKCKFDNENKDTDNGNIFNKLFHHIDNFSPRPLQESINENFDYKNQSLTIIEAPTGEGKTEAALTLAAKQMQAENSSGIFVAMPTQATSNMLYERFEEFLISGFGKGIKSNLVHGNSSSNSKFNNDRRFTTYDENGSTEEENMAISDWFLNPKLALISQFGVGTVDQTLYSVLNVKFFFLRMLGLAGKTVIFDEVHAYDTCMQTITKRLLIWLKAVGASVVILSATLPKKMKEDYLKAWNRGVDCNDDNYPLITQVTDDGIETKTFKVSNQNKNRKVTVELKEIADDNDKLIAEILNCADKPNARIAVLLNTVCRTQKLYEKLAVEIDKDKVELSIFHSRFTRKDRSTKEKKAIKDFGKNSPKTDKAKIIIATQVIEQSLDLDFDVMFTDIAPIDLLLQRAGRVHRHKRERPHGLSDPKLVVLTPEIESNLPEFSNAMIYEKLSLWWTYHLLKKFPVWNFSNQNIYREFVESVYGDDSVILNEFKEFKEVEDEKRRSKNETIKQESKTQKAFVKRPENLDMLFWKNDFVRTEENSKGLKARTRCSDRFPSSLLLIYENGSKYYLDSDFKHEVLKAKHTEIIQNIVGTTNSELIEYLEAKQEEYFKVSELDKIKYKNCLLWINNSSDEKYFYSDDIGLSKK